MSRLFANAQSARCWCRSPVRIAQFRFNSIGDGKEAVSADEIIGRVINPIGPTAELGHLIAAEHIIHTLGGEVADGVDLVVVLTAEDDLAGGGDVE